MKTTLNSLRILKTLNRLQRIFTAVRFVFFLLLWPAFAYSQEHVPSKDELSFDIQYCGGKIFKHTPKVHLKAPPYSHEVELAVSHRTFGKRDWEAHNKYPSPSLNIALTDYLSPDFGKAIGFYPAIEYNIIRGQRMKWKIKFGGGIAYATKHWERTDTMNNYIASHLNNYTVIQTSGLLALTKQMELKVGGRFSHISNGSFRSPNYGINLVTGSLGLNYYLGSTKPTYLQRENTKKANPLLIGLRPAFSMGELSIPDGPFAAIYSLTTYGSRNFLNKHRYFFGLDATYNKRVESLLRYSHSAKNIQAVSWNSTALGGIELCYGKVGIPLQIGVYTKKMEYLKNAWYQKVGMNYYFYQRPNNFIKKSYVSTLLKTHNVNADYIEFCLGFMF